MWHARCLTFYPQKLCKRLCVIFNLSHYLVNKQWLVLCASKNSSAIKWSVSGDWLRCDEFRTRHKPTSTRDSTSLVSELSGDLPVLLLFGMALIYCFIGCFQIPARPGKHLFCLSRSFLGSYRYLLFWYGAHLLFYRLFPNPCKSLFCLFPNCQGTYRYLIFSV